MKKSIKKITITALVVSTFSLLIGGSLFLNKNNNYSPTVNSDGGVLVKADAESGGTLLAPAKAAYTTEPSNEPKWSTQNTRTVFSTMAYTSNVYDSYRGDSVKVAIIDSGINYEHEDFKNSGQYIVEGNSRSYEKQSYKNYLYYDFSTSPSNLNDTIGHGTNVASVIASQINAIGCAGIAPNVELYIYKVTDGTSYDFDAVNLVLDYCITQGIDVINMSFQAYVNDQSYGTSSQTGSGSDVTTYLQTKLNACHNAGITLVAAAGNFNTSDYSYPAANNHVISVGSLAQGSTTTKAGFSNTSNIDLVAPGYVHTADIGSTSSYINTLGTSFSAPIVTAAIALYKQKNPSATPDEIEAALYASCDPISGNPAWAGNGRLNIEKFLDVDEGVKEIVINNGTNINLTIGETHTIDWTVNGRGSYSTAVDFVSVFDEIATVDSNGVITAISEGQTSISVESSVDPTIYKYVEVTVSKPETSPGETLSIIPSDFNTSYSSSVTSKTTSCGIPIGYVQMMRESGGKIQFKANAGYMYNTSPLSLYQIKLNDKEGNGTITVYGGNSQNPSTSVSGTNYVYDMVGYSYFKIAVTSNNAAKFSSIDVTLCAADSISVKTQPTKLSYITGQTFDPTGLSIDVHYGSSTNTVTYNNTTASAFTFTPSTSTQLTTANTSVTIEYAGKSTSVNITVTDPVTLSYITISGYQTSFVEGDTFVFGGTVTAHFSDNSTSNVTSSSTFSGYTMTSVSNQTVTVSYTYENVQKTTTYQMSVGQATLDHITVSGMQTAFTVGDTFSFNGTVTAHFTNGYSKTVLPTSVSSPNMSVEGTPNVTVSVTYNGSTKSTSYQISVSEAVLLSSLTFEDLPLSVPYKSTYSVGNAKVIAHYTGDTSVDVTSQVSIDTSAVDTSVLGYHLVTASYTEESITKTARANVKVTNNGASENVGNSYEETEESSDSTTFTTSSWGDTNNKWQSGKSATGKTSQGVQVAKGASGAYCTSKSSFTNVTKVIVTYSTNASSGAGSISIKVGSNSATSQTITKTGGTSDRTLTYNIDSQNGVVELKVTCTTNSIYVKSIQIDSTTTTIVEYPATPSDQAIAWATYFLAQVKPNCVMSGSGSDVEGIAEVWEDLAYEYVHMIGGSKDEFVSGTSSTIVEAKELYGIIISKYSMDNFVTDSNNYPMLTEVVHTYFNPLGTEALSIVLIIVVSLIAITSIVGYVYIVNKRK